MATSAVPSDPVRTPASGPPALLPDLPPISALFLIDFDVKAGYTIIWKQALLGLELEGVVEYKSLPSGLHTVPEDLIYFVHDDGHAGLSAFVNMRTDEEETRHARMIAVGVLVPLSYGRLGRAWRHAESLKEMAATLSVDRKKTDVLQAYWEKNRAQDTTAPQPFKDTPISSPSFTFKPIYPSQAKGHTRNRSASDGAALLSPGHKLSSLHPAWSLTRLLDIFGPLIFPIHRAALLRKRILISTHAPVHEACNFVYDISILSNIPLSVYDVIDPSASAQRLRPLFTIGVHDIPYLQDHHAASRRDVHDDDTTIAEDAGSGWVACTTDSILAMKEDLWDMLITLPPSYSVNAKDRVWPTVECPKGVEVKATQRDLRRFRSLKHGLSRLAAFSAAPKNLANHSPALTAHSEAAAPGSSQDIRLTSASRPGTSGTGLDETSRPILRNEEDTDKIVEPTTWAALAYNGFMWWASAGEQRHGEEAEESAHDATLLAELTPPTMAASPSQRRPSFGRPASAGLVDSVSSLTARRVGNDGEAMEDDEDQARVELAIIAYFHRLTTSIISVLADIVDSADDDDLLDVDIATAAAATGADEDGEAAALLREREEGGGAGWVRVDSDALAHMGLDVWSQSDAEFVRDITARYFARRAYVESKGVEICGLRVC